MKKIIGYYLFAFVYYICRLAPIKKKRVLCIMTHDDGEGSNVSLVAKALQVESKEYSFAYITKKDTLEVKSLADWRKMFAFFVLKPYQMARAEIILLDNVFLPFAYLRRRKGTKVVQLWHGTGTIKKFGQDVNTGKLKVLEKRANANITHLIVNSPAMKELYAGAFGVSTSCVYPIGLPKTDELLKRIHRFSQENRNPDKERIYQKYHIPNHIKLVLYAPTFRDHEINHPRVEKHLKELVAGLPEGYILGLRVHPFVAKAISNLPMGEKVCQLSFEDDVNTVLMATDILITDYSSIIFEYCLTLRPMVFYAYDYEEFMEHGRGFYYPYQSYVPGPVAYTAKEVCRLLQECQFDINRIKDFIEENYYSLDGNATGRLIALLNED